MFILTEFLIPKENPLCQVFEQLTVSFCPQKNNNEINTHS